MTTFALIFRILNVILMMGIPLVLAVRIAQRGKDGFRPIGIGIASFILSQIGHIPFNRFALLPGLKALGIEITSQGGWDLLVLGLALGLSAGIFEEITRFLVFRYWLNKNPHTLLPVKFGIGHGGIEAFLLGGLALVALIQVITLGGEGALLSFPLDQAELIQAQITTYWEISWGHSLLGAWERISALAFHLGASLLVFKAVRNKKVGWLVIAILGHTVLDAFAVITVKQLDFVLLESILFIFASGWLYWSWTQREIIDPEVIPEKPLPLKPLLSDTKITKEQLEESRYDED